MLEDSTLDEEYWRFRGGAQNPTHLLIRDHSSRSRLGYAQLNCIAITIPHTVNILFFVCYYTTFLNTNYILNFLVFLSCV